MDIDVEDAVLERYANDAGLLTDFTDSGGKHLFTRIDMTTRLQPGEQFAVVDQQEVAVGRIEDEGTGGDVPRRVEIGGHHCGIPGEQLENLSDVAPFVRGRYKAIEIGA